MSGGGKGGKTTTQVQIPKWLEAGAQQNMALANELAKIGYTPYFGPDVAALTPQQIAAMQGTNQAASAFGMASADPMAGMPAPETFAGGVQGYSSAPMYQDALAQLQATNPGQYAALMAPFINPVTGAQPGSPFGSGGSSSRTSDSSRRSTSFGGSSSGGSGNGMVTAPRSSGGSGGYTSLRDMFDGGGPGTPGSTYSGGPLSGALNTIGVKPAGSSGSSSGMGGGK
jgi:hypothetical protein